MTAAALELRDLSVRYGPDAPSVISGATFSLAPGERVALVGLNGAGKTSVLLAVAGLVPHEGTLAVDGLIVSARTLGEVRARIGYLFNVPEDQLLFPRVIDDVAFALRRRGVGAAEAADRARALLAALGVAEVADALVHHLSHGQKQRVALAGALITAPPLLLLDEPSAALDPPGKLALARLLAGCDAAMLVATHDLDFAARLCHRYVLLERGRVAEEGASLAPLAQRWGATIPE